MFSFFFHILESLWEKYIYIYDEIRQSQNIQFLLLIQETLDIIHGSRLYPNVYIQ